MLHNSVYSLVVEEGMSDTDFIDGGVHDLRVFSFLRAKSGLDEIV